MSASWSRHVLRPSLWLQERDLRCAVSKSFSQDLQRLRATGPWSERSSGLPCASRKSLLQEEKSAESQRVQGEGWVVVSGRLLRSLPWWGDHPQRWALLQHSPATRTPELYTPPHAILLVLAPACEISRTIPRQPGVERQKGPDFLSASRRALALSCVSRCTSHSARRNTPFPVETKARWHLLHAAKRSPDTDTCIALILNSQLNGPKVKTYPQTP